MPLFIPEKIKVGYRQRTDTYTGRLAYVIYYDEKGVLRKEKSWQSWRDKSIEPDEFKNEPMTGFVINKEARRCRWSHFGSNRSYIRIYDPRGIEFEISPDNLVGLLMESDCSKRMLVGEFIYAWSGTELILLPCGSESYQEAKRHTARQHGKISAKELKPGRSYTAKNGKELVYIGRFLWYSWDYKGRSAKKQHIFWDGAGFTYVAGMSKLSHCNSEELVQEYATLTDRFKADIISQAVVSMETRSARPERIACEQSRHGTRLPLVFLKRADNRITSYRVEPAFRAKEPGFSITAQNTMSITDQAVGYAHTQRGGWGWKFYTEAEALKFLSDAVSVDLVLESGHRHRLRDISLWSLPGYKR
jgi:hypothetical protein